MAKSYEEERNELDWIDLQKKLDSKTFQPESGSQKFVRKFKENPLVPLGCLATAAALTVGLYSMKLGDRRLSQLMMRTRVAAQGFTICVIASGLIYTACNQ